MFQAALGLLLAITVSITPSQTSVTGGDEFQLDVSASGLDPSSNYYIKALGGESFYEVQTLNNGNWLSWNSSWDQMPQFVTQEATESATLTSVRARFKNDSSGSKEVKVRVRKTDDDNNYDSSTVLINVQAKPSPSPTPTSSPTPSPAPTPTLTPSITPKPTPVPTKKPTPTPTIESTLPPSAAPLVMGEATSTPKPEEIEPKPAKSQNSVPIVSIIMITGGLGFMGISGVSFWKTFHAQNI